MDAHVDARGSAMLPWEAPHLQDTVSDPAAGDHGPAEELLRSRGGSSTPTFVGPPS